jgi:hypothetical protein
LFAGSNPPSIVTPPGIFSALEMLYTPAPTLITSPIEAEEIAVDKSVGSVIVPAPVPVVVT